MAAERRTVGSESLQLRSVGDPTLYHGSGRAAAASQGGMGPSGPGSD